MHVYCAPVFASKSEEIYRRIAVFCKQNTYTTAAGPAAAAQKPGGQLLVIS